MLNIGCITDCKAFYQISCIFIFCRYVIIKIMTSSEAYIGGQPKIKLVIALTLKNHQQWVVDLSEFPMHE